MWVGVSRKVPTWRTNQSKHETINKTNKLKWLTACAEYNKGSIFSCRLQGILNCVLKWEFTALKAFCFTSKSSNRSSAALVHSFSVCRWLREWTEGWEESSRSIIDVDRTIKTAFYLKLPGKKKALCFWANLLVSVRQKQSNIAGWKRRQGPVGVYP